MFQNCGINSPNLLINNIDNWDVSGIKRMRGMFRESLFQGISINNWDVSNVNNFANMFQGTPLFNEPLNDWDTSAGRFFGSMFASTTLFNQPLSNFVFSSTTGINFMFYKATAFNQPIGNWDVSTITSMRGTFEGAVSFDQDISNWDITNVTDFVYFLKGGKLSNTNYDNLLIGWEATLQLSYPGGAGYTPPSGQVDFGNSQYKVGTTARTSLINNFGWNITDGGPQ
jgi:surface protein